MYFPLFKLSIMVLGNHLEMYALFQCLDRLADCMAFGALEPCPECKEGQLVLDTYGYKCTGI